MPDRPDEAGQDGRGHHANGLGQFGHQISPPAKLLADRRDAVHDPPEEKEFSK